MTPILCRWLQHSPATFMQKSQVRSNCALDLHCHPRWPSVSRFQYSSRVGRVTVHPKWLHIMNHGYTGYTCTREKYGVYSIHQYTLSISRYWYHLLTGTRTCCIGEANPTYSPYKAALGRIAAEDQGFGWETAAAQVARPKGWIILEYMRIPWASMSAFSSLI